MDPQPPLLCRFSVRTLALIAAYIGITLSSVVILYSMYNVFDAVTRSIILQLFFGGILLLLNIQLRSGILKRNIVSVSLWLRVHFMLLMINDISFIDYSIQYTILSNTDKLDANKKLLLENALYLHGIIGVFFGFWLYVVSLYYKFEKKLLQQNRISGHQTV